ncbi:MAG: hypothetical protein GX752_05655 [Clostridium sp.]|nr:hypothetical protein [Clostridium sp.]
MNGNNILFNILFIIIIISLGVFAIRLIPYVLLLWFIYFIYSSLIKPLINNIRSGKDDDFKDSRTSYRSENENSSDSTYINTSKSVKDEGFFKKDRDFIDVDYDEKD